MCGYSLVCSQSLSAGQTQTDGSDHFTILWDGEKTSCLLTILKDGDMGCLQCRVHCCVHLVQSEEDEQCLSPCTI